MYPIDNCLQIFASQETIPSFIITKDSTSVSKEEHFPKFFILPEKVNTP